MGRSLFWETVYLFSNHHIEHHYFPAVPFYRLPRLAKELGPFFAAEGIPARTYRGLLWDWFVLNREPHTDWSAPGTQPAP